MEKGLKALALTRLSGFHHKTVKVLEWGDVNVVLRKPSTEAWYLQQEVLNDDEESDDTLLAMVRAYYNLEADVTLFCDVLRGTDPQRAFAPDGHERVLAIYGPAHARLLCQTLELIAGAGSARKRQPARRFTL